MTETLGQQWEVGGGAGLDDEFLVICAQVMGNRPRVFSLVISPVREPDRKRINALAGRRQLSHGRRHNRGIDPAGEEATDWNVRNQLPTDRSQDKLADCLAHSVNLGLWRRIPLEVLGLNVARNTLNNVRRRKLIADAAVDR